ncbi:MAG: ABC transporter ATP-binding protein [Bacilli bacterium]|nr:ABC transporter ATP-binding protein [Bacilli bacterium]
MKTIKFLKPYYIPTLIIFVLIYIQVVYSDLALPDYMSKIINNGIINGSTSYILKTGGKMILVSFLGIVTSVITGFLASRVGAKIARDLRLKVYDKVINYDHTSIKKFGVASLITRTTNDIQQVQMFITIFLRMVVMAPVMAIGGIIKILDSNASMTWIVTVGVVALIILIAGIMSIAIPKFSKIQKLTDDLNLVTRENLTGMLVIRAFDKSAEENKKFDKVSKDITKTNLFVNKVMNIMSPGMTLIMNGVILLIMWFGAKNIDAGNLEVGDMMAYIQYSMQIIMSFLFISMMFVFMPRAIVSLKRIKEVLNTDNLVKDKKETKKFNPKDTTIKFKNVSFRYDDAVDDILTGLDFEAKSGEVTAFIGSTGSGKSTLIDLVPRFYDVSGGQILIDDIDIRDIKMHDLRDIIGYVPQKGVLFSGTIESNIKYANKKISNDDMKKAAKISCSEEFILTKPKKFKDEIAQGGTNVSGGQKQRLSIARAIASNPKIYIFDDSFSALDFKTESMIRDSLNKNLAKSTILIVAQRVSSIMHADKIVVLDEGKIVGIGKHEDLMHNCPIYKEIALSQLTEEEAMKGVIKHA